MVINILLYLNNKWKGYKMKTNIEKIIKEIETLSIQSFNEKYPSWISNSLTTIELKLRGTLQDIEKIKLKEVA